MAKPLTKPQPTSSVANLLDAEAAKAALAPVGASRKIAGDIESRTWHTQQDVVAHGQQDPDRSSVETPHVRRQFILTDTADFTLKHLVGVYERATRSGLTNSHFLRAVLKALEHATPHLEEAAERIGKLKRPKNDHANEAQREEFERQIAASIIAGMRETPDLE